MTESTRLREDLDYVRKAVERTELVGPRSIFTFWALAILVGFTLGDFAPERMPLYWTVVGPVGWVVSAFLGARYARRVGQLDLRRGWVQGAHFGLMVLAIFLGSLLAREGLMSWEAMGPLSVLLLALGYGLAGVHFHVAFLAPAALFLIGFGVLLWVDTWPWTLVGVLSALGLFCTGWLGSARDGVATT